MDISLAHIENKELFKLFSSVHCSMSTVSREELEKQNLQIDLTLLEISNRIDVSLERHSLKGLSSSVLPPEISTTELLITYSPLKDGGAWINRSKLSENVTPRTSPATLNRK